MKKIYLFSLFLISLQIKAQDLSLNKALELAKSAKLEQINLDVLSQEINIKIQKNKRLPLIYGDATLQRNLIVPTTPVPSIAFNSNASSGEITPLKFATDWSAKAGIQVSVDLFNTQNKYFLKSAELDYQYLKITKDQTNINFKKTIIDLYAQAYIAQQQYDICLINEINFQESVNIITERYKVGRVSEYEKNETLQKAFQLEMERLEAELILKNKYLQLSNYIDLTVFDNFSTSIDQIIENEIEFKKLDSDLIELDIQNLQAKIKNNDLSYLPKLSLNAFYGSQYFGNDFNITNSNNWFGNSFVNLNLRIPISENVDRKLKSKQLEFDLENLKNKLNESIRLDEIALKQQKNEITLLSQKLLYQKKIISLAEENLKITKAQLDEGTILVNNYNKALENYMLLNLKRWEFSYNLLKKQLDIN